MSKELVGPGTANTMDSFRDHDQVRPGAIRDDIEEADAIIALLLMHGDDLIAPRQWHAR